MAAVNFSQSGVGIRNALAGNMQGAYKAGMAMATGNAILHAYEDPTGLAIGSSMLSTLRVQETVKTGIEQSVAMLYMAEAGLKAAHHTVTQMYQTLAKAKLGYMTDQLVETTLSPEYKQLKAEIDRIADSVDFNGQKLLNGTGGVKSAGVTTKASTTPNLDFSTARSSITDITLPDVQAGLNGSAPVAIKINGGKAIESGITVSGGNITPDYTTKKLTVSGATITISGVSMENGFTNFTGDIVMTNAVFTVENNKDLNPVDGAIQGDKAVTFADLQAVGGSMSIVNTGTAIVEQPAPAAYVPTTAAKGASVSGVISTYTSSGGQNAISTFKFVTGTSLNKDFIDVAFPNISLETKNGILGIIPALNVQDLPTNHTPVGLSNLTTVHDADLDAPLVDALQKELIVLIDAVGAYQKRFLNIQAQLDGAVEELDNAQGAIMNSDLAKESRNYAASSAKVNVAITVLGQQNDLLKNLQRIVAG